MVNISLTIGDVTKGIEYWLNEQIFKEDVEIENISWKANDNSFMVKFKKENIKEE